MTRRVSCCEYRLLRSQQHTSVTNTHANIGDINHTPWTANAINSCSDLRPGFNLPSGIAQEQLSTPTPLPPRLEGRTNMMAGRDQTLVVIFTALHALHTRSSHEEVVCTSASLSISKVWIVTKHEFCPDFIPYEISFILVFRRRMVGGGDPFSLKF